MELSSIGKHIKEKRISKSLTQEKLAERTGLCSSYIGMIERGEKIPKMETFIKIINVLEASPAEILADVTNTGFQVRMTQYADKFEKLSAEDREKVLDIIDILLNKK